MGGSPLESVFLGTVLLLVSCGGGGGQTVDGGNGGGGAGGAGTGAGGHGGSGGAGGQAGGTGGSNASCPAVSPCGGNIVGTWKITQSCISAIQDLSSTGSGCTGASANSTFTYSGTLTFNADNTYTSALAVVDTVHEHFPSGCKPFGSTCDQLASAARDAGITDTCSLDSAGGCNCDAVQTLTPSNPAGTYTTAGSTLTTTETGKTPSSGSYCVQGNMLYDIPNQGDGGTTVAGDIVFTRQ